MSGAIAGCLGSKLMAALEREMDLIPFAVLRWQLAAAAAVQRHLGDLPRDSLQSLLQAAATP